MRVLQSKKYIPLYIEITACVIAAYSLWEPGGGWASITFTVLALYGLISLFMDRHITRKEHEELEAVLRRK